MARSACTNEMSNKVDSTPTDYTTDEASGRLLASGFTPPSNKEAEIHALRSANCKLQARLSGYLVFPQMMEKKAKECKSWKLRALKAEKELKLISSSLTRSQLEELQRQNVVLQCGESSLRSDRNDDSSLESCQATGKARDRERHLECAAGHKEQHKSDGMTPQSKVHLPNMTVDTDDVDILKQQIATYIEDFQNERKDRERLVAVCEKQRRDIEVLLAEKNSIHQQLRQFEDELHSLRQDNATMRYKLCPLQLPCREVNTAMSRDTVVVATDAMANCMSPNTDRRTTRLSTDEPHLF